MKITFVAFILLTFISMQAIAARGVKCRVFQKSLRERVTDTNNSTEFTISKNHKKSAYLNTVISQLDAEIKDDGVLIALKNGLGSHQSFLKLKKGKNTSKTFELPSERADGISNQVYLECLK